MIIFIWFSGFLFSVVLGGVVVKYLNLWLRNYIGVEKEVAKLTPTLGCIERAIYTLLYIFGGYQFIAIWFGIKVAQKLVTFTKIENKIENKELPKKVGERINVFLICNIVSLCFGILGGLFITHLSLLYKAK